MKSMNSSKKNNIIVNYEEIMKQKKETKKVITPLKIKNTDWRNGENFEIFTLLKNIPSGTTSTDSCLISSPNA